MCYVTNTKKKNWNIYFEYIFLKYANLYSDFQIILFQYILNT